MSPEASVRFLSSNLRAVPPAAVMECLLAMEEEQGREEDKGRADGTFLDLPGSPNADRWGRITGAEAGIMRDFLQYYREGSCMRSRDECAVTGNSACDNDSARSSDEGLEPTAARPVHRSSRTDRGVEMKERELQGSVSANAKDLEKLFQSVKSARYLQHVYLHQVYLQRPLATARYHDLQVELYAAYSRKDLLPFLRRTLIYRLERLSE